MLKNAALYDEVRKRCLEIEKEIEALKTKFDVSDDSDSDDTPRKIDNIEILVGKE